MVTQTATAPEPAGTAGSLAPRLSLVALGVPIVLIAIAGAHRRWMSDDGYINARVVEQILAGNGPVYNAGERVEVTTSTLWLWLMVAGRALTGGLEVGISAVWLGVALTVAGFVLVTLAGLRLTRPVGGIALPAGTLVLAALPPMWDFASSGLETGLGFCWIGACCWLLARRLPTDPATVSDLPAWRPLGVPVVIGLGPLVRPDFALFSLAFAIALVLTSRRNVRGVLAAAVAALALPLVYEVFRAGYFAALVPNTAIAKDASGSDWSAGFHYLSDLYATYWLLVPLLALAAALLAGRLLPRGRGARAVAAAPFLAGALHTLYVVRVGGDFMHGRMLLPGLFAMLAPLAVLRVASLRTPAAAAVAVITGWALVAVPALRVDYGGAFDRQGLADERSFWSMINGVPGPVTSADWTYAGLPGAAVRRDHAAGISYYKPDPTDPDAPTWPAARPGDTVIAHAAIGIIGYEAGTAPGALVVDRLSLADPITARVDVGREGGMARPGHTQEAPEVWRLARYADLDTVAVSDPGLAAAAAEASAALGCGELGELSDAVTEPLTWPRFWRNVALAPALTTLSIPGDPATARAAFCGP